MSISRTPITPTTNPGLVSNAGKRIVEDEQIMGSVKEAAIDGGKRVVEDEENDGIILSLGKAFFANEKIKKNRVEVGRKRLDSSKIAWMAVAGVWALALGVPAAIVFASRRRDPPPRG